mmetsp:Transcript_18359/g.46023  ORF Transcript_18359/g.46023 Transcript_18359/m.46023 type:complete len:181 (-) Transcript_18359:611-1153(-)
MSIAYSRNYGARYSDLHPRKEIAPHFGQHVGRRGTDIHYEKSRVATEYKQEPTPRKEMRDIRTPSFQESVGKNRGGAIASSSLSGQKHSRRTTDIHDNWCFLAGTDASIHHSNHVKSKAQPTSSPRYIRKKTDVTTLCVGDTHIFFVCFFVFLLISPSTPPPIRPLLLPLCLLTFYLFLK